ncbi:MAG: prephenate dehydrogenase [Clostridiales bacterium]|nr:prephenate dehydrogenase [Clostridiales bacterium]
MNVAIIGLGLMGGSLGRALCKYTDHTVWGRNRTRSVETQAVLMGAIHKPLAEEDLSAIDMLVVCLNPQATLDALAQYAPKLKPGAILTDIAGEKRHVTAEMRTLAEAYPQLRFVATHPMAGREFSGFRYAVASLFQKASVLIVPVSQDLGCLAAVKKLWQDVGATVLVTDAPTHDAVIAYTSQLPHLISSAYIKNDTAAKEKGYSAGSFRDLSRVAHMNTAMWTELMLLNRDALCDELGQFIGNITAYYNALSAADAAALTALIEGGNLAKDQIK